MKIQIVMGFALPIPTLLGGAVEKRWHGVALELARRHDVTMFSCRHPQLDDDQREGRLRHVRLNGFRWSNRRWLNATKSVAWSCRLARRLDRADVLITNDVAAPILLPHLRKHLGLVCIDVARMPKLQHRWLYSGVDRFYCTSSAVAEAMGRVAPGAVRRSVVLPNSIDLECFSPAEVPLERADRLQLLYVGRIHPEKGIDTLLHACKSRLRSSQLFLRIVGPALESSGGDPAYAAHLRQLAQGLGLTPADWRLDPPVFDDRALANIYRGADIFAYPSQAAKGETFGLSILEAMGCGKPCLVSSLACFRDLVRDGENGFVVPSSSPTDWAAAIDRLISEPAQMAVMGRRARQLALMFNPEQIALRLEADLEQLLEADNRRRIG